MEDKNKNYRVLEPTLTLNRVGVPDAIEPVRYPNGFLHHRQRHRSLELLLKAFSNPPMHHFEPICRKRLIAGDVTTGKARRHQYARLLTSFHSGSRELFHFFRIEEELSASKI
jgi:hypothetical protein